MLFYEIIEADIDKLLENKSRLDETQLIFDLKIEKIINYIFLVPMLPPQ